VSRFHASGRAGRRAETLALLWLMTKGFWPLARRHGGKGGEIDLILRRGRLVIFVEVKQRASLALALEAVSAEKRRLITRTVRGWLARNPWAMRCSLRADAVFLAPWHRPRHMPGVFELIV